MRVVVCRALNCLVVALLVIAGEARGAPPPSAEAPLDIEEIVATRSYTNGTPGSFAISGDGRTVLFLRGEPRSRVQQLYAFDVASGRTRRLADVASLLGGVDVQSPAERARRERQRLTAQGIATFVLSRSGDAVLVPASGKLFVIEVATGKPHRLAGVEGALDARFSPNGSFVSYVRDHDLYVSEWRRGRVRRLTRRGSELLTHGEAEFVAQEEMHRSVGYWWSPDSKRIAFEEADCKKVERRAVPDPANPHRQPLAAPYPRPGTANAAVRLGIVDLRGGAPLWVRWDNRRYEYLATVKWSQDAPLTLLVQSRDQREQALLAADTRTGISRTLLTERDPAWINLRQSTPWWLAGGRQFLWMNERDGEWRVWLHDADGRPVRALNPGSSFRVDEVVHVDESRRAVIVSGGARTAETQLYELPLEGGTARRLTKTTGVHTWSYGDKGELHVAHLESQQGSGPYEVRRGDGTLAGTIESLAQRPPALPHAEYTRAGEMECVLIRPKGFQSQRRYPVLVDVYAGPGVNQVSFAQRRNFMRQWLADQGVIVVAVDGRGTPGRGRVWERSIRGDFGSVPLEDQVRALKMLGARYRELDLSRVAIYGFSFGGYMAAMAIARRPDVFRAGVALAAVADWTEYDTHYTERYLGLLPEAAEAYRKSSVLTYIGTGPSRPLLIVHGTSDDNVTFNNSLKLAEAFFRKNRPFEFLPVVGETHLFSTPQQLMRVYRRMAAFLQRELR